MRLFSFDKTWDLDWQKTDSQNIYNSIQDGFVFVADTTRSNNPLFSIYQGAVKSEYCLDYDLDNDFFIMQLKSLKETHKLLIKEKLSAKR